jgi:GEVED domain/Secretion system C-terminal sorting domain
MMKTTTTQLSLVALALLPVTIANAQSRLDFGLRHQAQGLQTVAPAAPSAPKGGGYCAAGATGTVDFDLDERIVNVTFSNINNNSPNVAPTPPAYTLYASPVGNVTRGMSYTLSVNVNTTGLTTGFTETQVLAWIDYNQDADFDDIGEQVLVSAIDALDIYSGSVTIPVSATLGNTRMRIRMHDTHDGTAYINDINDTPCGDASYGEIEDYILNITSGGGGTPPNDDCTGATISPLAVPGTLSFSGDNTGATEDGGTGFIIVWEAFTIASCANVDINYCVPGFEFDDFLINLAVGCPDFLTGVLTGTTQPDGCTLSFLDLPAGTYYIPVMVDPAMTPVGAYTIAVSTTACGGGTLYCDAGADGTGLGLDERITNVTMSDLNNSSPSVAPVAPAYSDFTAFTANVTAGQSYPISIGVASSLAGGTSYAENQALAWIDFNQDGDFIDVGEQVFVSTIGAVTAYTGNVTIPVGATLGVTRMRVRLHDTHDGTDYINNFNDTPCGLASYGEVEDYSVNITGGGGNPPANDDCDGATVASLTVPSTTTFSGDNTDATLDVDANLTLVWEAFTLSACANVDINYCVVGSVFDNFLINLSVNCPDYLDGIITGVVTTPDCVVSFPNLPAGTYYIPVLVDPAQTPIGPYTISVTTTACASPGDYCEAGAVSIQFEKISNLTFGDINNNSSGVAGYEDFTAVSTEVVGGVSYPISVTISGGYDTDQVLAWIDWDHNSAFDAGEIVFSSAAGVGPHTGNITVPLTALAGPTRMRVRLHDTYVGPDYQNTPNPTPCDTSTFGQVEDYTVDMIGIITGAEGATASAWTVFPNPNNGDFTIRYGNMSGLLTAEVLDLAGRVVHSAAQAASVGTTMQMELAGKLAAGTYVLRLSSGTGFETQRITIR